MLTPCHRIFSSYLQELSADMTVALPGARVARTDELRRTALRAAMQFLASARHHSSARPLACTRLCSPRLQLALQRGCADQIGAWLAAGAAHGLCLDVGSIEERRAIEPRAQRGDARLGRPRWPLRSNGQVVSQVASRRRVAVCKGKPPARARSHGPVWYSHSKKTASGHV